MDVDAKRPVLARGFFGTNYSNQSSSLVVRSQSQSALLFKCTPRRCSKATGDNKLRQHVKLIKQGVVKFAPALISAFRRFRGCDHVNAALVERVSALLRPKIKNHQSCTVSAPSKDDGSLVTNLFDQVNCIRANGARFEVPDPVITLSLSALQH